MEYKIIGYKIPESSFLKPPHKIEGTIREARESFYKLAKGRIKYFNHQQFIDYISEIVDEEWVKIYENMAVLSVIKNKEKKDEEIEKHITNLEIVIDTTKFNLDEENYEDILPFAIEHEIYETWLRSKMGFLEEKEFSEESRDRAHKLAMRKEFLLAEKEGKAERLFNWRAAINPNGKEECLLVWESIKKKLR